MLLFNLLTIGLLLPFFNFSVVMKELCHLYFLSVLAYVVCVFVYMFMCLSVSTYELIFACIWKSKLTSGTCLHLFLLYFFFETESFTEPRT